MKTMHTEKRLEFIVLFSVCLIGILTAPVVSSAMLLPQDKGQPEALQTNAKTAQALDEPVTLLFDATPWSDIEETLEASLGINIALDQSAQNDSLSANEPITIDLHGIRAKNALTIMLWQKNATFRVKDGTVVIYSLDDVGKIQPDDTETPESKKLRQKQEALDHDRIAAKLETKGTYQYNQQPWSAVESDLEKKLHLNLYLASSAKDDSLTENEPITFEFTGTAKDALNAMLRTKHATLSIENEVVVIRSLDDRTLQNEEDKDNQ